MDSESPSQKIPRLTCHGAGIHAQDYETLSKEQKRIRELLRIGTSWLWSVWPEYFYSFFPPAPFGRVFAFPEFDTPFRHYKKQADAEAYARMREAELQTNKEEAVKKLLSDPAWRDRSTNDIARELKLSWCTVDKYRRKLGAKPAAVKYTRKGREQSMGSKRLK